MVEGKLGAVNFNKKHNEKKGSFIVVVCFFGWFTPPVDRQTAGLRSRFGGRTTGIEEFQPDESLNKVAK